MCLRHIAFDSFNYCTFSKFSKDLKYNLITLVPLTQNWTFCSFICKLTAIHKWQREDSTNKQMTDCQSHCTSHAWEWSSLDLCEQCLVPNLPVIAMTQVFICCLDITLVIKSGNPYFTFVPKTLQYSNTKISSDIKHGRGRIIMIRCDGELRHIKTVCWVPQW